MTNGNEFQDGEFVDEETGEILHDYPQVYPGYQTGGLPIIEPPKAAGALAKRVSKAILSLEGRIPKSGYNAHFKFKYVTSEDVKQAARQALAEQEVFLLPSMNGLPETTRQGKQTLYTVKYWFTLFFPEGVAHIPWVAESLDTSDKGLPKSLTTSVKYFLISLLLIPTGDEEDADKSGPAEQSPPQRQSGRKPAKKGGKLAGDGASGATWPGDTILAVKEAELIVPWNAKRLMSTLNLSKAVGPKDEVDVVIWWLQSYKEFRADGKDAKEAAEAADTRLKANQDVDEWVEEHAGVVPEKEEPEAEAD